MYYARNMHKEVSHQHASSDSDELGGGVLSVNPVGTFFLFGLSRGSTFFGNKLNIHSAERI
jgi:hypothetical protein